MKKSELLQLITEFCSNEEGIEFVRHIDFYGNYEVALQVKGPDCVQKLDEFLTTIGVAHTKPDVLGSEYGCYAILKEKTDDNLTIKLRQKKEDFYKLLKLWEYGDD